MSEQETAHMTAQQDDTPLLIGTEPTTPKRPMVTYVGRAKVKVGRDPKPQLVTLPAIKSNETVEEVHKALRAHLTAKGFTVIKTSIVAKTEVQ